MLDLETADWQVINDIPQHIMRLSVACKWKISHMVIIKTYKVKKICNKFPEISELETLCATT